MLVVVASYLCYIDGMKIVTHRRGGWIGPSSTLFRVDKLCVFGKYIY